LTYGNAGRNSLRGAGRLDVNLALVRRFAVRENQNLEVRAEAFNLPNTVNYITGTTQNPAMGTLSSPQFGRITQAYDPRILQFALKYTF
jgi:hypothetical protein